MKRMLLVALVATLALSLAVSAQIPLKIWNESTPGDDGVFDHLQNARDIALSREPDLIENVDRLAFWDRGADNYISSMSGLLVPPATGEYVFSVYGDDHNGLYLSPDADPANIGDLPVCYEDGWSNEGQWDAQPSANSDPIMLEAGKGYAFRTIQREGGGGDGHGVGWAGPGFAREIITAQYVWQGPFGNASPVDGAEHVSDVTLSWAYLGADEGVTYTVHFGSNPDMMMPLATPNTELPLGAVGSPITPFDTVLYWKVVASDGMESPLWSFTTEHDRPQFDRLEGASQPSNIGLMVGEEGTLACNAVTFLGSAVTYQWYKVNPGGDDILIDGATENTLTAVVSEDDEGQYYCVATSAAGSTASNTVIVDIQHGLIHRWTFNDGDVAEVDGTMMLLDVVGGADAVLVNGTGNATVADGQVILANNGHGACDFAADDPDDNNPDGDYVDLPNGLISSLDAMTVECWSTWDDDDRRIWSRIWSFGTSNCGEDSSCGADAAGPKLVSVIPYNNNGDLQIETRNPQTTLIPGGQVPLHKEVLVTVTYDDLGSGLYKLFVNGVPLGSTGIVTPLKTIPDVNNWLGRSQWCDPLFEGSFNELRIYDTILSADEIAANYLAGPDELGTVNAPMDPTPCDDNLAGDVNGDCVVDLDDAAAMIEDFLDGD